MENQKPTMIAAGIAFVAIGLFAFLRLRRQEGFHGRLGVIEQRNCPGHGVFPGTPPGIYLRIEEPQTDLPGSFVTTKVVDAEGYEYPIRPVAAGWQWIPFGYAHPPTAPRLVATLDSYGIGMPGKAQVATGPRIGEVRLRPFPAAESFSMPLSTDAPFRLRGKGDEIFIEPKEGVQADERWDLELQATDHARDVDGSRGPMDTRVVAWGSDYVGFKDPEAKRLLVPYPSDTRVARMALKVTKFRETSESIRLPNLRFVQRQGETAFDFPRPRRLSTHFGTTLVVKAPTVQARRSSIDHRNPMLAVELDPASRATVKVDLLSPSPEELGVRYLTIGQGHRVATGKVPGSVDPKPFTAVLRVTRSQESTGAPRTYTVPIERR